LAHGEISAAIIAIFTVIERQSRAGDTSKVPPALNFLSAIVWKWRIVSEA
jgi:hypothetical protein